VTDALKTYKRLTPREQEIATQMRRMLDFIARGEAITEPTERVAHAWRTVGYAEGTAKAVLKLLEPQ
jgi:hypothetical protein